MWFVVTKCAYLMPHSNICSHWLITRKVYIQSFVLATVMKHGMWAVVGTVLPTRSVVSECAYLIPRLHICSDRLMKKAAILSWLSYTDET